jgi:hypothetical protein
MLLTREQILFTVMEVNRKDVRSILCFWASDQLDSTKIRVIYMSEL